jgi:protease-4
VAQGLRLGKKLRFGTSTQWNWGGERDVQFTMDFGLSYRPVSWLGLGAVARNAVGDGKETPANYSTGIVLRPMGDHLLIGADYELDADAEAIYAGTAVATMVLQPVSGFLLRGQVDDEKNWGVGVEFHLGGSGLGFFSSGLAEQVTYSIVDSQPGQGLQGPSTSDDIPFFKLSEGFAYEPVESFFGERDGSYLELLRRLRNTAEDPGVQVIALATENMSFSLAQLQELRSILMTAKDNGKKLVAYLGEWPTLRAYYLAALCDHIVLHPGGDLIFTGIGIERHYYAGTLALAGIEPQFSKQGDYKSAVETFTRTGASEKATEQTEALLDDLWTSVVAGIAHARGLSEEEVSEAIDAGPMTASQALEGGWVDELGFKVDFEKVVQGLQKGAGSLDEEAGKSQGDRSGWGQTDSVAVVYVTGPIVPGKSKRRGIFGGGNAGADTVAKALRRAVKRKDVKAVVLRVDSPGGSATASEDIWKAVTEVQAAGKPVVVSMGGVAASGGYYVSASADAILAEPTTITGSIGAFAGRFNLSGLYEKLGVSIEFSGRGRMANMFASGKAMDPIEWERFDALARNVYDRFIEKVAEGREMSVEEVTAVASGRVWSGEDALEHGLVDQLGGFEEAIALAAEKAGMEEGYRVVAMGMDLKEDLKEEIIKHLRIQEDLFAVLPEPILEMMRYEWLMDEHLFMMLPYSLHVY